MNEHFEFIRSGPDVLLKYITTTYYILGISQNSYELLESVWPLNCVCVFLILIAYFFLLRTQALS